jgi:hypothetical protein
VQPTSGSWIFGIQEEEFMTDVNSCRATSRAWFGRALLVLAVAAGVASSATVPARADDDHRGGNRHYDRRDEHYDNRDRGDRRDYHPYGGYAPGYVYAPPPVYYAPPPLSPGINLIFPLRIR